MRLIRCALFALLASAAASAQEAPRLLRSGSFDITLLGNYTDWAGQNGVNDKIGESVAFGFDYGINDGFQAGLAVALPIHPGAAFGSLMLGTAFALGPKAALRVDAGIESLGENSGPVTDVKTTRYVIGAGPYFRVPLGSNLELVWGRAGVARMARFTNVGSGSSAGAGVYLGTTYVPVGAGSDALVLSTGGNDTGTVFDVNVPLGLAIRPAESFSLTLQAGYSLVLFFPSGADTIGLHYLPIGLEAAFSPVPTFEIGANGMFDGYIGSSGASVGAGPGYFDLRTILFWLRIKN